MRYTMWSINRNEMYTMKKRMKVDNTNYWSTLRHLRLDDPKAHCLIRVPRLLLEPPYKCTWIGDTFMDKRKEKKNPNHTHTWKARFFVIFHYKSAVSTRAFMPGRCGVDTFSSHPPYSRNITRCIEWCDCWMINMHVGHDLRTFIHMNVIRKRFIATTQLIMKESACELWQIGVVCIGCEMFKASGISMLCKSSSDK